MVIIEFLTGTCKGYKFKNNGGSEMLHDIFEASSNIYNTRSDTILNKRNVKSIFNRTETVS